MLTTFPETLWPIGWNECLFRPHFFFNQRKVDSTFLCIIQDLELIVSSKILSYKFWLNYYAPPSSSEGAALPRQRQCGQCISIFEQVLYCICIRTRGGISYEIQPEPKEVPEGAARMNFRGLRPCFIGYPDSSPNTDIIPFL